jgi:hypothetical protein
MNGAEVYASRMMLLLAPVSASALSRCSSLLTIRLDIHYQLSVCMLDEMMLLALKSLEEVNKYSCFSPSSSIVVKLISVERMDSAFLVLFLLLAVFSGFNCLLSTLVSSKRKMKAKDFFPGSALASKQALLFFCCLNLQSLCNQPCCGWSCHNSDTTCWTPYDF